MSQDPPFPERHARRLSRPDSPPPSEENRTTPFPKLSRYSNPQKIGEGNMGLVFKATDPRLDREIAVKILRPNHKNDPLLHKKFQNEARSLGQLDHPHIIPIFDMGQTGESLPFFTMKKVEGKTLAEHLATLGNNQKTASYRYDGTRLLYLFLKVCEALSFAHFQGIIHRDLKPENIMLGPYGEVLITDWGLARQIQPAPEEGESETSPHTHSEELLPSNAPWTTQEGQIVGTPMYMSPEQARGENHRVGPRSDIYSLGCVLYEILTLSPPYEGKNVIQILAESTEGNIVPPTQK
ncbi:MAG: serine/threonine-protein kinase, partial [Planctomycetota bacterium]|nr:serine/threonine-protein kinase [Planctomycetota bacterium]